MARLHGRRTWLQGLALLGAPACVGDRPADGSLPRREEAVSGSRLRVVGTVQDGGLPHAACACERCEAARHDPTRRRYVASLALNTGDGRVLLVDATPDIRDQLAMLRDWRSLPAPGKVDRTPLDGILLTHAHIGHYLGLAMLGFEVVSAKGVKAYATPKMAELLRTHAPWEQLVRLGNIELVELTPGTPLRVGELSITPRLVPHRDEYSDTVGYRIAGPHKTVLYIPDTAPWERWTDSLEDALRGVDVALLDGCFYSMDELPGRDVGETGHPLMVDSMRRLAPLVAGGLDVRFTHLNHSNPALTPGSAARRDIERRGFAVLDEGTELAL